MGSMQGTVAGVGLASTTRLPRPSASSRHFSLSTQCPPDEAFFFCSSHRSSFFTSASDTSTLQGKERAESSNAGAEADHTNLVANGTRLPGGSFLHRAFVARPATTSHSGTNRQYTGHKTVLNHKSRHNSDGYHHHHLEQLSASTSGLVNINFAPSLTSHISADGKLWRRWAYLDLEVEELWSTSRNHLRHAPRVWRHAAATGLNPVTNSVQYLKEPAPQHQVVSTPSAVVQLVPMGRTPAVALRTSPSTWSAPSRQTSRTVRVAHQARLRPSGDMSSLPQYSQRVGKAGAKSPKLHSVVARQSLDLSFTSAVVDSAAPDPGEAWVRAAEKLGFGPKRSLSAAAAAVKTAAWSYDDTLLEVEPTAPFTLSSSRGSVAAARMESKLENGGLPGAQSAEPPSKLAEPGGALRPPRSLAAKPEGNGTKLPRTKEKDTAAATTTGSHGGEGVDTDDLPETLAAAAVQPAAVEADEETHWKPSNDSVLVVDSVEKATAVVKQLMSEYRHLVHACDTEVAEIDVKKESPVGHGRITCFSIYCGPSCNFGEGKKNRLWVDVLDGGEDVLRAFKPYFEDAAIMKVWHNYSFDKHILGRHGIFAQGFYADTMHLARLWDSARRGAKGGYSLEVLSADEKVMDGYTVRADEDDAGAAAGKKSMKDLFGKANVRKDGTPGKLKVVPPVEELQQGAEWRELWIHYSTFDAVCTWRLWQSLQQKLKRTPWTVVDMGGQAGSMYDFYEKYWQPFGEVLVQMEADGMLVDCDHLADIEKVARNQQQISASRFRKWAAKYCPDADLMNVGSDAQIRQLLFGGTANRKDQDQVLPMERVFSVPNTDGFVEADKKVPKKTRPIVIKGLAGLGIRIPVDTYTSSGWPAVGGAAIKALAGKVAIDYTDLDADADEEIDEDIPESEGLLTSGGVKGDNDEDLSVYGKAYDAFGGGQEGKEACMALAALCEVASINTLISNFIEPLQGNEIKSTSDGRVHCSLNINTETGRLSARRPSLQNQPALEKDRYKIRQAFVAAPGKSLVVADYGQLELRILAHLAKCRSMKEAFRAGGDFHSRTAMNMYPHVREAVEKERVLLEWEGLEKPPAPLLKDVFGSERRKAKMLNFSIAYGKTAMGLAKDWKVSIEEAKATVALWYSDRPEVLAWQKERKEEAHQTLRVHTLLGRTRHLPDVNSSNSLLRSHMERAAINTPVQGSAADVAMCAMLEINRSAQLRELGWKLLLQVHDEVILEGPTDSAELAKDLVIQLMMHPFDGKNFLDVELAVDGDHALNWYAAK